MKIAVVTPRYGFVGGAENFVHELTERLALMDGFEIHVLANQWDQGNGPITFHKVPIIPFPRWLKPVSFAWFAQKIIRSSRFDVVHSHERILKMDLLTFHGIPHATWIKETKRNHLSLFDRATAWVEKKGICNGASPMVLPVSHLVKGELLKLYDIPTSNIEVLHPGVNLERFSKIGSTGVRKEVRKRYGLSESDIVVLFVGMNFEIKRLELVMKGVAYLVSKGNKNVKILIVGKGGENHYSTMARSLGIGSGVIFTGVSREVENFYLASDIFAMPSVYDTFGLVVLEAMAAGLPVIISQRVGAKDLIESGENGFVLPDTPTSFDMANAISLLMEARRRKQVGEKARQAVQKHDWAGVTQKVAELYQKLNNRKSSA
ncbi:glycosyltransferase family 4 protein [Thermodesulfobacteriota bacterium]